MLNYLQATAARNRGEDIFSTASTLAGTANQPNTAAKKKKKKKKPLATGIPATAENPPSATCLTATKAAVVAAEQAAEAAEAALKAAKSASGATVEAASAARAARAAVKAAAEAVKAAETLVAAEQEAEAEKATGEDYSSDDEYQKSLAGTTFLYVPVEGDIQVRQTSTATKEEILEWPVCEGHTLCNHNLANERYILTGYIRSFNFDGPINKRYSRIYGKGTATIHGPAIIFNEDGRRAVSLTEKDIPIIFR
ncbi:hypothetical protein KVV02_005269 [Mortierella alpina]|uniref:Uncharacterized protein n=1 Tax=Mortierella alpina TaxID=64518 RepID=A0A9P8CXI3_MORAP|nr:hypothetical protein KVV02_005269 [Mortierella alpina]